MDKTCLLHGCLLSHCRCEEKGAVSVTFIERVVDELPPMARMAGMTEDTHNGKYKVVEKHSRYGCLTFIRVISCEPVTS